MSRVRIWTIFGPIWVRGTLVGPHLGSLRYWNITQQNVGKSLFYEAIIVLWNLTEGFLLPSTDWSWCEESVEIKKVIFKDNCLNWPKSDIFLS